MQSNKNSIFLPLSIILSGIIIAITILYAVGSQGTAPKNTLLEGSISTVTMIDDDVILGDPEAKLTLTMFGDYQCPICKQMFDDAEKKLRTDYVETGLVNLVYRDFPIDSIHPYARGAALAAECAGEQGKYWDYHDALFVRQESLNKLDFTALAKTLGLHEASFQKCLDSQKYAEEVEADFQYGVSVGIAGTPTLFIGDEKIEGWSPEIYQQIRDTIDEKLKML